jgi:hypothetical protein
MRKAAQVSGIVLIVVSGVLWLWLGFWTPLPRPEISRWLLPSMYGEMQLGLTPLAFLAMIAGGYLWRWGRRPTKPD